jgi:3-oxoadipate enol-lactonase
MHATILGNAIYHEVVGDGIPLIFVHGLGATSNVWHAQRAGLSRFCKVVTLDLPGSGRSDRSPREYSMEKWADQVVGLADHLGMDRFVPIGHSMTTILVQKLAAKYPTRVRGAVVCGAMIEPAPAGKEAFVKRMETVMREGMGPVADLVLGGALCPATREANAGLAGLYREMLLCNEPANYAAQCKALIDGSAKADLPNIRCPLLVMVGDQDAVTPLANAQAIAAAVPSARIRVIPATAHATMIERPELFNAALLEFLATLP